MKNLALTAAIAGVSPDISSPCAASVKKVGSIFISTMCSAGGLLETEQVMVGSKPTGKRSSAFRDLLVWVE